MSKTHFDQKKTSENHSVNLAPMRGFDPSPSVESNLAPSQNQIQKKASDVSDLSKISVMSPIQAQGINQISRKEETKPTIKASQAPPGMIQPARGRVGRVLASILSLSGGAFASSMTYGSKDERRNQNSPNMQDAAQYTRTAVTVPLASGGELKGNKYAPVAPYLDGAGKGKVVLLLSGSGGTNLEQLKPVANKYCKMGSTVYGIDYRGYGNSGDNPMLSEKGFNHDARAMFNFVIKDSNVDSTNIVIHGFSLGGAIAAKLVKSLAQEGINVGGLVLHSAIDSAYKAARDQVGIPLLGQIAGAINKGAAGNFDTRAKLKEIAALDPNLPIHLMSGKDSNGDQLGLDHTHLDDEARKRFGNANVTSHISGTGGHLETEKHMDDANIAHLEALFSKRQVDED